MFLNLLISALVAAGIAYRFGLDRKGGVMVAVVLFILSTLMGLEGFTSQIGGFGSFGGGANESRAVCYGDDITVWSWKNKYMRLNATGVVDSSDRLSNPEEIPRNWVWEHFTIEDSDAEHRWFAGSRNPVKYGDVVYLRTWKVNWVSPRQDGTVRQGGRGPWEKIVLESPDITGLNGRPIQYGDQVYLKTWRGTYLSDSEGKPTIEQVAVKGQGTLFRIFDRYGHGPEVDWAARGMASQSSTYQHYTAGNTIDGNLMSFAHTQEEASAWWRVELPRDINITKIVIVNRKDCCQGRLADFDVSVLNSKGNTVFSQNYKEGKDQYILEGIGRIGRTVKVQLRGKNFLHLAEVKVFGTPVNYSTLLDTPVVATLVAKPQTLTPEASQTFHADAVPYIGNNSMSLSFFLKPRDSAVGSEILTKGTYLNVSLDTGGALSVKLNTEKGVKSIKSATTLANDAWNHISIVLKPSISRRTGWQYGMFTSKPAGITADCCYLVNSRQKEYYHVPDAGASTGTGGKSNFDGTKEQWSAAFVEGMKYKGELDSNFATVSIYINGLLDSLTKLDNDLEVDNDLLVLGKGRGTGVNGQIQSLKFYNYAITQDDVARDARMQNHVVSLDLVRGEKSAVISVVPGNILPDLSDEVSVTLWFRFDDLGDAGAKSKGKWQTIFSKGASDNERMPALLLDTTAGVLSAPLQSVGDIETGIKTVPGAISAKTWYHAAVVLRSRDQYVYVNGVKVAEQHLASDPVLSASPMHIGGFIGRIKNMRLHNFALSEDEVRAYMGVHPDYKTQETVQRLWNEQGCTTKVNEALGSVYNELVQATKDGALDKVEAELRAVKAAADAGNLVQLTKCYGKYASGLRQKLNESGKNEKPGKPGKTSKKCLPIAPFTCSKQSINDFDIRTHRDFHKYTPTANITQSPIPVKTFSTADQQQSESHAAALAQLTTSRQLATNILQGLSGMDSKTVDNIIRAKQGLSDKPEYKALVNSVASMGQQGMRDHPEYQKLVKGLNQLTTGDVDRAAGNYQDFKVQAEKCQALLTSDSAAIPTETLLKIFKARSNEPEFKALANNIIESTAAKDGSLREIIQKAQDEQYISSPEFQAFLLKVTKQQLRDNPVYQKMVASMIAPSGVHGRIEDNPEYNKYAEDMQRSCLANFR